MAEALTLSAEHEYALGNAELPIANHRAEIETAIAENAVTIIVAPTGSGKTTQVPQFACEMLGPDGRAAFDDIIVTQPRIVAARTVSERVAQEIADANQANKVGYYTSKEGTAVPQRYQDIAFLTDGKAAAQLLYQGKQPNPTTKRLLIIDEVHEWNLNTEQLIAIATEKTDPNSQMYDPNLKVVIMSATMDSTRLQKHFGHITPPIIKVEVPTYEVTHSASQRSVAMVALELAKKQEGTVLAFLPGTGEIRGIGEVIAKSQSTVKDTDVIPVIPLHGQQSAEEQALAFLDYKRAVVAVTNAAQTSLTVPSAVAVVDSGEVRTDRVSYDLVPAGSEGLYLEEASQADLKQRAGRVGRTGPGEYVLCSPDGLTPMVPHADRPEYATPAMERSRLDSLLLTLKATDHEIGDFRFFHKPPQQAVKAARKRLFNLGALNEQGKITERGSRMAELPLDPEYACMVAFANEKGYSDEIKQNVLDIAAIMQLGGIAKRSPKEQNWRQLLQRDAHDDIKETDSDFIAQHEAYVELINNPSILESDWAAYGINEHAAGLVEQGRASLANKLGVALHSPAAVAPDNRQRVLTCINAGQLNQLWQRNGETWSLALEESEDYPLSESSVVGKLGKFATGTLFSLGSREAVQNSVQDVNRVVTLDSLEQAAGHLVTEVLDLSTARYDPEQQGVVAQVNRMLGSIVLRSFPRMIEVDSNSPEGDIISDGHLEHAWITWVAEKKRKEPRTKAYGLDDIADAIANPERAQFGYDFDTNEPLWAWKGGNGNWCRTKEIALDSLMARQKRLANYQKEAERRLIREAVKEAKTELIALNKSGQFGSKVAKRLLSTMKKRDKQEWLGEAQQLLRKTEVS